MGMGWWKYSKIDCSNGCTTLSILKPLNCMYTLNELYMHYYRLLKIKEPGAPIVQGKSLWYYLVL